MPTLADPHKCTGCTACAAICPKGCITMVADENGFSHPLVNESTCIQCGLCEKKCPIRSKQAFSHMPTAYAARSVDTRMRLESSSGGVFSELAQIVLAQRGAVFGAAYDDHFRVIHICAEDEHSLARLRGAKYAQSDLFGVFDDVKDRLTRGQEVLFSGTPCQVGGLKAFLGREYENLVTVDFVCHGVPSPMAWERFVKELSVQSPLLSVNLRAKDTGWSRYQYCHALQYADGMRRLIPNSESLYMKLFVGDLINRQSCSNCSFKGYARRSDLTLGDFWGIWDIAPEMDDNCGTSLVLVQSEKGRRLWNAISSRLVSREVTLEEASYENPSILYSSSPSPNRDEGLSRLRRDSLASCAELLPPPAGSGMRSPDSLIRRSLRFLKRHLFS